MHVSRALTEQFENHDDVIDPIDLVVTGDFPAFLDSSKLYRTGPGSFSTPLKPGSTDPQDQLHVNHWFDGFTQNHRFAFTKDPSSGKIKVTYNSRHSSNGKKADIAHRGFETSGGFSQTTPKRRVWGPNGPPESKVDPNVIDPQTNMPVNLLLQLKAFAEQPRPPLPTQPDSANVGVTIDANWLRTPSGPTLVARTDANMLQRLDPVTLEPVELFTWAKYNPDLTGQSAASHSEVDTDTNEEFNFNLKLGPTPSYQIFKIKTVQGGEPKVTILAEITKVTPCYIHSLFTTKKYVVLGLWQAIYKYNGSLVALNGNLADGIEPEWDPSLPTKFYVIDRSGQNGIINTFTAPAHYCFHTINAYDDGDDVVLNYCHLDTNSPIWKFQLKYLRSLPRSFEAEACRFARVRLPSVATNTGDDRYTNQAIEEYIASPKNNIELPQIHPAYTYTPFRYVYGIHSTDMSVMPFHGLIRYDTNPSTPETDRGLVWAPENVVAGEPFFVASQEHDHGHDTEKDRELDGILLSLIYDGEAGASGLVALDPATMKEVGRAMMPRGTIAALGFHGSFIKIE